MVVAGGHQQDTGKLLAQSLGGLFQQRKLVRLAFVEAVDVCVVEDAEILRGAVGLAQSLQGFRRLFGIAGNTVEDSQVERFQSSLPVEVAQHFEIRRSGPIEAVEVDIIIREEIRPPQFVLLPRVDRIRR